MRVAIRASVLVRVRASGRFEVRVRVRVGVRVRFRASGRFAYLH